MTTRHAGYIVVLADDVREDDAEAVINALRMVKGVARVQPVVASVEQTIASARRDVTWIDALHDLIDRVRKS